MTREQRIKALRFDLDRVVGYHNMRAGFYRRWHQRAIFAIIFALSLPVFVLAEPIASFVNSFLNLSGEQQVTGNTVGAVFGLVGLFAAFWDIVANPAEKISMHRGTELVYQNIRNYLSDDIEEAELKSLETWYNRTDSGFEERHVVVNVVSRNRVLRELGLNSEIKHVPWWKKLLMHYFSFSATKV